MDCNKYFVSNTNLIGLEDLEDADQRLVENKLGFIDDENMEFSPKQVVEGILSKYADSEGLTGIRDVYKYAGEKNITEDEVKSILKELEEQGKIYYPEPNKINLI